MEIILPENVELIINTLQKEGFEAYAVGGCIRDSILERKPNDWDITTSALPQQVKNLFRRTVDTGIEHGTVTVLLGNESFEVTTYRTDGEYKDSRHPESVEFVTSLEEDLKRRDFTINAMAYNYENGLMDPFDGYGDLEKKCIRCVGDPNERFREDALRIFRAVRFSAQLSFQIEERTAQAIKDLAPTLEKISAERISAELIKLLLSPHPDYIKKAYELGMTAVFLPEFDRMMETEQNSKYHIYNVGEHTIKTLQHMEADKILRLTMLLHDVGKPECRKTDSLGRDHFAGHAEKSVEKAKKILRRLKLDNETIQKVLLLIRYHDWRFPANMKNVRKAMRVLGKEMYPNFLKVQRADAMGKSDYIKEETLRHLDELEELYKRVIEQKQCVSLKELSISGKDILELGVKAGPSVGKALNAALDKVLEDPGCNESEFLKNYIKNILKNGGLV